jgi:hypothetical protein
MYLLTKLSPSWGSANCAATQAVPSILWNPEVQYHVHKSPPLVPILSHINPIHTIPSYLRSILILSTQWSPSFWLSHQYPICIPLLPYSCYMPCPFQNELYTGREKAAQRDTHNWCQTGYPGNESFLLGRPMLAARACTCCTTIVE